MVGPSVVSSRPWGGGVKNYGTPCPTHVSITVCQLYKFARRSEQLSPEQISLLDELLDTDIAAIEAELKVLSPAPAATEPR